MRPGPDKQFDVDDALASARDVFWRDGFDGTSITVLESELGIGRKSLYDTFGGKRELYLRSIDQYVDTVIQRICDGLARPGSSAIENLERVLDRLQKHHGSDESLGCLLGVATAQVERGDTAVIERVNHGLDRLERAFERAVRSAQEEGAIDGSVRPRDAARHLVALTQGIALLGRLGRPPANARSAVRAALAGLHA